MDINESLWLRLSSYADYILNCDKGAFMNDKVQMSRFINTIVDNFWKNANAMRPTEKYNYQGNFSLRFQLDSDLLNKIEQHSDKNIIKFYSYNKKFSPARLIAAILEEYAKLPFVRREEIFYWKTFDIIQCAIEDNNSGAKKRVLEGKTSSGKLFEILPIRLCMDEWSTYNYLVGLILDKESRKLLPTSLRISKIVLDTLKRTTATFEELQDNDIDKVDEAIKDYGVMFVSKYSKKVKATICLKKRGKEMYDSMNFMRPQYTEITNDENGDCVMIFECTERQIQNYFQKFGEEIEVLEPTELRDAFRNFYNKALEKY